jgi:hypothetical protein
MLNHYYSDDYINHLIKFTNSKHHVFSINGYYINLFEANGKYGKIFNSGIFFGSHGGFKKKLNNYSNQIELESVQELTNHLQNLNLSSLNIIENPYCNESESSLSEDLIFCLKNSFESCYQKINRSACIRFLQSDLSEDDLLMTYHQKTRNCVRKFKKSNASIVKYSIDDHDFKDNLFWLFENHKNAISSKNGLSKPWSYFESIPDSFDKERYELVVCYENEKRVGGLLNFIQGDEVEYWTPVITEEGRKINAIYGIIHHCLYQMSLEGKKVFNFGASWSSQSDLLRFKQRFGSETKDYNYHCFVINEELMKIDPEILIQEYKYFFVRGF